MSQLGFYFQMLWDWRKKNAQTQMINMCVNKKKIICTELLKMCEYVRTDFFKISNYTFRLKIKIFVFWVIFQFIFISKQISHNTSCIVVVMTSVSINTNLHIVLSSIVADSVEFNRKLTQCSIFKLVKFNKLFP